MTRWGPERNPTVGAALVADTEYPGVPRSCFGAESSQTSRDNKAEIKGPISRQRGVMRGFKTGLRGEESDLLQLKLFPWLLRAFVGGNGGTPADDGKVQPPVRESPTFSGEEQDVDGNPSGSPWVQLSAWGGEGGHGEPPGMPGPQPTPDCSMGCSHWSGRLHQPPHRQGDGKVGDAGVVQARSRASRGCS